MIRNCQVNHLDNPLGFLLGDELHFHWITEDLPGTAELSDRIILYEADPSSNNEEDSEIPNGVRKSLHLIHDTGWTEANSLSFPIKLTLKPRTRYAWTVSVRTNAGAEETSTIQYFETGKMDEPWFAKWISCDNTISRHPVFSKEIIPSGKVVRARLYITGLGLYQACIGGKKIGDEFLAPGCNNYTDWIQVQTYDVTDMIQSPCTLSVTLGNGWYKGRFGFTAQSKPWYGDSWKLLAELVLTMDDGSEQVIGTDDTWAVTRSNITFSNIYDGEHRDDTLSPLSATTAMLTEAPDGKPTDRLSVPVSVIDEIPVKEKIITPAGELVLDMGQNLAGIWSLKLHHPKKGQRIHLQFGEVLQDGNFYNGNLRTAKAEYCYISNGTDLTLQPVFTFYGYRYVKIEGITNIQPKDFTALVLSSSMRETCSLITGDAKINRLIDNANWSRRGNFIDVPTDCPQRDERMGWTGDAEVFCPTALYQSDATAFYTKFLYDLKTEQKALNGMVPVVVPSFDQKTLSGAAWSDAAVIMPWTIYEFTGDASILKKSYESMKDWVEYIRVREENGHQWMKQFQFGDWLALDGDGKSDSVFGGTDNGFVAEVYYLYDLRLLAASAEVLDHHSDADEYRRLAESVLQDIQNTFYTPAGHCCVNTQTACLLTLVHRLSPKPETTIADLQNLLIKNDNKLKTGFIGTPLLCETLSAAGDPYRAWQILYNEDYPGWLYEINLGATTIWERWNSLEPDGKVSSTGMNSFNHYSYGAVVSWLYSRAAGLRRAPGTVGFRKVIFAPEPNVRLGHAEISYDSASGLWKAGWKTGPDNTIEISLHVPFGCEADIILPYAPENRESHVGSGDYQFTYQAEHPFHRHWSTQLTLHELLAYPPARTEIHRICPALEKLPAMYRERPVRECVNEWDPGLVTEEQYAALDEALTNVC